MSQKASPTAIGAFVLGATALIIAGLLFFGSGKFFKEVNTYSLYFTGNAKGLNVGAPIGFRGVKIGSVTEVRLIYDTSTDKVYISVVADIDRHSFYDVESIPGVDITKGKEPLPHLIDDLGLRAKLATLSMVTGQLFIEFDFFPDTPANLYGFKSHYAELPTVPSTMEEMQGAIQTIIQTLSDFPVRKVAEQLNATVAGINKLVSSPDTQEIPAAAHQALANLRDLSDKLNKEITPLTSSLQQTSETAGTTFADVSTLLRDSDTGQVIRLAESIELAANQARALLADTNEVVSSVDVNAVKALVDELSRAARSIRVFADYLDRHPDALLRGKN